MTPVLQTRTSWGRAPILRAARDVISWASMYPCCPTEVLAMPALTMMARERLWARFSRLTVTVEDLMVLVVKTPAAMQGRSETMRPRSSLSSE